MGNLWATYAHTQYTVGINLALNFVDNIFSFYVVNCFVVGYLANCSDPPEEPYATRNWSSTLDGDRAYYTCNLGYSFRQMQLYRLCLENGSWSLLTEECLGM